MALAPLVAAAVLAVAPPTLPEQLRVPTEFRTLIYCVTPSFTPTVAAVRKLVKSRYPHVRLNARTRVPGGAYLVVNKATVDDFPPPPARLLRNMQIDLTEAEMTVVPGLRGVVGLTLVDDRGDPARGVAEMNELLAAVARPNGCFILDHSTRLIFSVNGWRALSAKLDLKAPRLSPQINKHLYTNGQLERIVTLGMEKFGLPDLAVDQFAPPLSAGMEALIEWICNSLAAGRLRPGGWLTLDPALATWAKTTGKAEVRLRMEERQEGDADNRLLTVDFSDAPGASLQERQSALLTRLLGPSRDPKKSAPAGDAELVAASTRARARWPEVAARCAKGLPFPQKLSIKRAFVMPGGETEYMWISVTSCHGKTAEGVLMNDAYDPAGPRAGLHVRSREADVYDYSIWSDGKEIEGGETERILSARERR